MQINSPSLKIMANPTESKDAIRYEDLFRDTGLLNDEILPVASQTSLGAIKAGNGVSISEDGILDITNKADKSYVDDLVGDINTILASVVGGGS